MQYSLTVPVSTVPFWRVIPFVFSPSSPFFTLLLPRCFTRKYRLCVVLSSALALLVCSIFPCRGCRGLFVVICFCSFCAYWACRYCRSSLVFSAIFYALFYSFVFGSCWCGAVLSFVRSRRTLSASSFTRGLSSSLYC
jgi:hypothetical protein